MARATIKKDDVKNINLFLILTNGIIDFEAGNWYIDTPDDFFILHSTSELIEFVNENIPYHREQYETNGEMDVWDDLVEQASAAKLNLKAEREV